MGNNRVSESDRTGFKSPGLLIIMKTMMMMMMKMMFSWAGYLNSLNPRLLFWETRIFKGTCLRAVGRTIPNSACKV